MKGSDKVKVDILNCVLTNGLKPAMEKINRHRQMQKIQACICSLTQKTNWTDALALYPDEFTEENLTQFTSRFFNPTYYDIFIIFEWVNILILY